MFISTKPPRHRHPASLTLLPAVQFNLVFDIVHHRVSCAIANAGRATDATGSKKSVASNLAPTNVIDVNEQSPHAQP